MTDRQLFMDKLRLALDNRGVSEDDAAIYLNDRFYDVLAEDSADNVTLDKVDMMADGIAAQLKARRESTGEVMPESAEPERNPATEAEAKAEAEAETETEAEAESAAKPKSKEDIDAEAELELFGAPKEVSTEDAPTIETDVPTELLTKPVSVSEETITLNSVIDELFDEAAKEPTAEIDIIPHGTAEAAVQNEQTQTVDTVSGGEVAAEPLSEYDEEYSDYSYADDGYIHAAPSEDAPYTEDALDDIDPDGDFEELMQDDTPSSRLPDYVEEKPVPNNPMFWVLFFVTSLIWIPLLIAGFAVFAGVWVALAALIVAAIAAMVAVVAVGSAASLIGIVYGIIEACSPETLPLGIYNIGLGIIAAGVTMFVAILMYNFALRLLPWVMRLVGRLFRFVLKKLKLLFNHLRRECAKQ